MTDEKRTHCRICGRKLYSFKSGLCVWCLRRAKEEAAAGGPGKRLGRLPAEPTAAPPGTPWKIAVMARRRACGESLFHPDDAADHEAVGIRTTGDRYAEAKSKG